MTSDTQISDHIHIPLHKRKRFWVALCGFILMMVLGMTIYILVDRQLNKHPTNKPYDHEIVHTLAPSLTFDRIKRGKVLARGGFGTIYIATVPSIKALRHLYFVEKHLILSQKNEVEIETEERVMEMVKRDPSFPQLYKTFRYGECVSLLMEYFSGGCLHGVYSRKATSHENSVNPPASIFQENTVKIWIAQTLLGINKLHKKLLIHADVKLLNIFLSGNHAAKLADFGSAIQIRSSAEKCVIRTYSPHFSPPEIDADEKAASQKMDIWGLGVAAYMLLTGHYPFLLGPNKLPIRKDYIPTTFSGWQAASPEAQSFVLQALTNDYDSRPTAADLMKHSWFKGIDWNKIADQPVDI